MVHGLDEYFGHGQSTGKEGLVAKSNVRLTISSRSVLNFSQLLKIGANASRSAQGVIVRF